VLRLGPRSSTAGSVLVRGRAHGLYFGLRRSDCQMSLLDGGGRGGIRFCLGQMFSAVLLVSYVVVVRVGKDPVKLGVHGARRDRRPTRLVGLRWWTALKEVAGPQLRLIISSAY
jgi:hypothetical protein